MGIQCIAGNWDTNLRGYSVPNTSDASWTPGQLLQTSFAWAMCLASHPQYLCFKIPMIPSNFIEILLLHAKDRASYTDTRNLKQKNLNYVETLTVHVRAKLKKYCQWVAKLKFWKMKKLKKLTVFISLNAKDILPRELQAHT